MQRARNRPSGEISLPHEAWGILTGVVGSNHPMGPGWRTGVFNRLCFGSVSENRQNQIRTASEPKPEPARAWQNRAL